MILVNINNESCSIETVYDENQKHYYSVCRLADRVVLGFSSERAEALEFCLELIKQPLDKPLVTAPTTNEDN